MRASKRTFTLLAAAAAGCLTVLAVPATPAAAAPAVTLSVTPAGHISPSYDIQIHNGTPSSVNTTVRQELPRGLSPIAISHGGHANASTDADGGTELNWQIRVPAGQTETVSATMTKDTTSADLTAPACAFTTDGTVPDDCATATWSPPRAFGGGSASMPWWRSSGVTALAGAGVLLGVAVALVVRAVRRRRARVRDEARQVMAYSDPRVYPKPRAAAPRVVTPRRRPPIWLPIALALVLVGGLGAAALWTATSRVSAMDANRQPSSGAWLGSAVVGPVGASLRESAFEFTVYRVVCPTAGQPCTATVGLRNVSDRGQRWYGTLQRAYLPGGDWVSTDEAATRAANHGKDLFADVIPPGERQIVPVVFQASTSQPTQLEFRSAVFSAGVRVNLT